jgi:hypothetical protein
MRGARTEGEVLAVRAQAERLEAVLALIRGRRWWRRRAKASLHPQLAHVTERHRRAAGGVGQSRKLPLCSRLHFNAGWTS